MDKNPKYFETEIIFDKTATTEELTFLRKTLFSILEERTRTTLKKSHLINNADNYLEIYVQYSSEDLDDAYHKSNRFVDNFINACEGVLEHESFLSKVVTRADLT